MSFGYARCSRTYRGVKGNSKMVLDLVLEGPHLLDAVLQILALRDMSLNTLHTLMTLWHNRPITPKQPYVHKRRFRSKPRKRPDEISHAFGNSNTSQLTVCSLPGRTNCRLVSVMRYSRQTRASRESASRATAKATVRLSLRRRPRCSKRGTL